MAVSADNKLVGSSRNYFPFPPLFYALCLLVLAVITAYAAVDGYWAGAVLFAVGASSAAYSLHGALRQRRRAASQPPPPDPASRIRP
jgi:hypothetical protein